MTAVETLVVVDPGLLATVQDLGRRGAAPMGVSPSGAVDWFAARAANRLVGNPDDSAVIETTLSAVVLSVLRPALVAVTGADAALTAGGRRRALWSSWRCREGDLIELAAPSRGVRSYIAIEGGFAVPKVMGSSSTDVVGRFGGRVLLAGDRLSVRVVDSTTRRGAQYYPAGIVAPSGRPARLRAMLGPHAARAGRAVESLFSSEYRVGARSSRQAVRLEGDRVAIDGARGLVSEGVCAGCVQVAGDGLPTVLLAEHQTTGGYPVALCVILADLPVIAQARPGDTVRFERATMQDAAHALALRAMQLRSHKEVGAAGAPEAARLAEGFFEGATS